MSRTRVGPRTLLTAVAASALVLAGAVAPAEADPATAFVADDLSPGSITTSDVVSGAFTIMASGAKAVTVDAADRTSDRGDVYSQRLKLNGSGAAAERSLRFDATAGTEVTVHARSGSGTSDRALALYDASWTEVDRVVAAADSDSVPVATEVLTVPADGTYWLASPSSGVNVFYAELDVEPDTGRTAWTEVASPVVDDVVVDPDDPSRLLVAYTGTVGPDGGDLARAALRDADGNVVDQAFTADDGATGTLAVEPPSSGTYSVQVSLTRSGEPEPLVSEPAGTPEFSLPLALPEISGILTTAVSGTQGTVTIEWAAVAEAETYSVEVRQGSGGFTTAADGITGTSAEVGGLSVGETYEARVVAHRGGDSAASGPVEFAVADAVERWQTAHIGVGSGGQVLENGDGSITFDALANSGKAADSEDGFWYRYTAVDPATENFTLSATFHVDDSASKDNQSGFGIVAVDDLVPNDTSARYMNSAGASVAKYRFGLDGEEGVRYGTPGAKFVRGYTGPPTQSSPDRDMTDSRAFDWDYKDGYEEGGNANPPRFQAGDDYELTLRRSNTGFHATWHHDGEDTEVIEYDPDLLLTQDDGVFYVGLFAARKIKVTVTDWSFETIHPDDDEPAQDPPPVYVTPELNADVTRTTPGDSIDVPLTSNVYGEARVTDAAGEVVADGLDVVPGERTVVPLDLVRGTNDFTATLVPDAEQPQFGEREELESLDPVELDLTFTARSYGEPGQAIRVAPNGDPGGDGTANAPLDLHTAVAYAQPGQQIVLAGGTYHPQEAVVIERGRDGTADAPITLMSQPGTRAVLDLSESETGGIWLRGDHWHLYDLEITRSQGYRKPLHISGNHNVIEKIESHHNQDTGLQISGLSAEPPQMWPSDNLVVSCESHDNRDPLGNDADGFGVKLTVGEGNVIRHSIAHHNIDDGWDLYAKSTTGPIGVVTVEDSVAYDNGWLAADDGLTDLGEGNGFKLGGESMPGAHILRNSVSFGNLGKGVTSNSGPDVRLENVTSVGNGLASTSRSAMNVQLKTAASSTDYRAAGVLSWQASLADDIDLKQEDTSLLSDPSNYFDGVAAGEPGDRPAEVTPDWFVSTDAAGLRPEIGPDGSVVMHGLYELTDLAPSDTGARLRGLADPTEIELLPDVVPVAPWYPTGIYTAGDVVSHQGIAYQARWWTRGDAPADGSWWGPWVALGPAAMPPVEECAPAWVSGQVYTRGDAVSYGGVNHVAYWWTLGAEPGSDVHGAWGAVTPCR
ncbi:carbohydrate-binding protein [Myceligenerans indicum]|uniref:Fibronectin type-III domain-containing protein n=1 Tax=Myceligenerans indicum TaxID=2593663 RepID=A0ABS1LKU3_9MICO|nr:carbohydrate-binding protein [Myceligenerans indicum]MBL0886875.1 hypothetical protein [Myceligenerans indicum]